MSGAVSADFLIRCMYALLKMDFIPMNNESLTLAQKLPKQSLINFQILKTLKKILTSSSNKSAHVSNKLDSRDEKHTL